jgi:F-type H+-transporting ATPase subunit delta
MMAEEYGKALFSLASESSVTEKVLDEIKAIALILKNNPEYIGIQDSPAVTVDEKEKLLSEAFSETEVYVKNLMMLLAASRRFYLFFDIVKEYTRLYNESKRICTAQIITAVPLDKPRVDRITKRLSDITGMTVIPECIIDKSLIGGIKLRYLGKELDGSIKARLEAMEKSLKGVIV